MQGPHRPDALSALKHAFWINRGRRFAALWGEVGVVSPCSATLRLCAYGVLKPGVILLARVIQQVLFVTPKCEYS